MKIKNRKKDVFKKIVSISTLIVLMLLCLSACGLNTKLTVKYEEYNDGYAQKSFKGTSGEKVYEIPFTYLRKSITKLADFSIANAEYLEELKIGANILEISNLAIVNNSKLKSITVSPQNPNYCSVDGVLYSKDKKTLIAYPNLKTKEYVVIDGVETISANAFYKCNNLTSVVLPQSVKIIEDMAFMRCSKLTSINIPDGVTSIGVDGMSFCSDLPYLFLPISVTNMGDYVLFGCSKLTKLNIEHTSLADITVGKSWLPLKEKAIFSRIPVEFASVRG